MGYRDDCWKHDIESFSRIAEMRRGFTTQKAREMCTAQMVRIQARWPQFISLTEVQS